MSLQFCLSIVHIPFCFSTTFMLIMLAVDLIYAFVDPRIKAQYEGK